METDAENVMARESGPPSWCANNAAHRGLSPGWPAVAGHDTEDVVLSDIVAIARTWLGTPYVHQASIKGVGCDCLGLLRGVWRELHGAEPEEVPPYSPDWAEATGTETLYTALARHLAPADPATLAPGDIALFRMSRGAPAKHCGIVTGRKNTLTLFHARQNRRVSEEPLSPFWRSKLAYAFRSPN